jgi:beta-phosphoglucomutase
VSASLGHVAKANIRAVAFDLDDTLVATEPLKALSYARAAAEISGGAVTEKSVIAGFKDLVGRPREAVAKALVERFHLAATPDKLIELRLHIYEAMLAQPDIIRTKQLPHAVSMVKWVRHEGLKTGLATMSHRDQVDRILSVLGLSACFDAITTVEEVKNGKPDPEIYLLVSKKLGVPPPNVLVIEDSPAGAKSALAAGMPVVAVTTDYSREAFATGEILDRRWVVDDASTLGAVMKRRIES